MSVYSRFLTLSIKEQLWITILILTIFSALVILCLPGSFSFEILMEDYKRKKSYFYSKYKDYIEASFYFQSLNILKYEELLKRMSKQIFKYSTKSSIFKRTSNFKGDFNESYPVQDLFENNDYNEDILYQYCYNKKEEVCKNYKSILRNEYESLNGLIFSHDMIHRLRDTSFDLPLISSFVSINVDDQIIYGFNKTGIYNAIVNTNNYSNINKDELNIYYQDMIHQQLGFVLDYLQNFLDLNLFLFNELFNYTVDEIYALEEVDLFYDPDVTQFDAVSAYSKAALGFYPMMELSNDKCYLATHNKEENKFYYFQFNLMEDYISVVNHLISDILNIDVIPLFPYNHTILSPELCVKFLTRQSHELFDIKVINETFNNIYKGYSGIEACFYDKKMIENKKIREMFETNVTHFLMTSNIIYQGLIELGEPYYFMKYSFPNSNILMLYKTDYLYTDQIDFFLFSSFKEPFEYSEYIKVQYKHLFYLIVILILYIWIICFIVNMIIYFKVIKQILEPINKLQKAIETNNIKDENIFKYEYDNIINELFITCKELLTGQKDTSNNLNYSGQFSIINQKNDEDKNIDKKKYEKNLIIDNEMVNKLINEQHNMMNYKKEIDCNDDYSDNNDISEEDENEYNYLKKFSKSKSRNIDDEKEDKENMENIVHKKNEEGEKDKTPYKNLFKLADYLYHYRCKVEENNIKINTNSNNDDKKSNKSRIYKQNPNSMRNQSHKKTVSKNNINDNNEDNMTVNVLKGKDLTYLWFMEMKNKNNKSFNYELSDDLEELFMD